MVCVVNGPLSLETSGRLVFYDHLTVQGIGSAALVNGLFVSGFGLYPQGPQDGIDRFFESDPKILLRFRRTHHLFRPLHEPVGKVRKGRGTGITW
jgi:hypothetical protein